MIKVVEKVLVKSGLLIRTTIAGILLFLLQIPAYQVQNRIGKEVKQNETGTEVSRQCAGPQAKAYPALLVPFLLAVSDTNSHATTIKPFAPVAFDLPRTTVQNKNL